MGTAPRPAGARDDLTFTGALQRAGLDPVRARAPEILQLNLGRLCNQACSHCHVDAGPTRKEIMSRATAELCIDVLANSSIGTVDLTGGAPELCPSFEFLVSEARRLDRRVLDRCNLTVLNLPKYESLPAFLAANQVQVISSLPDYRAGSTDLQRGAGVYAGSLEGIRKLNRVGYGRPGTDLELVLVSNPVEPKLPGPQACMEKLWKEELLREHGLHFSRLITITNMPIRRYLDWLRLHGKEEQYMALLKDSFNPSTACGLMCRNTLSVDWLGNLYDCDFNQMLGLATTAGSPRHLRDFDGARLKGRAVVTGDHCFGCTAGAGSSCSGATA